MSYSKTKPEQSETKSLDVSLAERPVDSKTEEKEEVSDIAAKLLAKKTALLDAQMAAFETQCLRVFFQKLEDTLQRIDTAQKEAYTSAISKLDAEISLLIS